LTKQQNDFKITLKKLEDNLLSKLSAAEGNFLGDSELVENLEHTKRTAEEIEVGHNLRFLPLRSGAFSKIFFPFPR